MKTLCFFIMSTCLAGGEGAAPLSLPFRDAFTGDSLESTWAVDVADGNSISLAGGQVEIKARTNTYAHIERPLGQDFVRASCAIKPGGGVTWTTSLFIYWDPGQWLQFGIIPDGGGHFWVTEMNSGIPTERRLSPCPIDKWHHLAIELAVDCIRYLHSEDGERFKPVLVTRRPGTANRTPTMLIVGKGYSRGAEPYPAPDLDNDYADPGPVTTSVIRDVRVERLDWSRLRASDAERADWGEASRDPVADAELVGAADPTFDSVARHFPAMKWPREVVGVKDHPHDVGIAWDGALQFNDAYADPKQPIAFFEIGDPPQRFGSGPSPCRKRLLDGHLPVVIADWAIQSVECQQTVFGWTEGMSADAALFACVRLELKNNGTVATRTPVHLCSQANDNKQVLSEWRLPLDPGASKAICVKLPWEIVKARAVEVKADEFDARLAEVRRSWQDLLAVGERFVIPEPRVRDAYRAWLAYSFLNVDKRDGVYHICDGAGFYEQIYGYSAALYCHILDLMGYHDLARTYLDSLLTFQQPDGLFYVNFGHTDTGTLLHVMALHYEITGDADWLRRVAPHMIRMCDWIIAHRPESMKHIHGKRAVVHGLIRFRPYCDHELPAFDYYSNCYLCTGMADTAAVLAKIGMSDQAARLRKESESYRADILSSMDAAVVEHEGVRMLPMMPDTLTLLKESQYSANGYYGLVASCLLEAGVLQPADARTRLVVDMLENHGGLVGGTCQFFGMIDHAYTYGYWQNCLERDDVRRVILGFYGSMAFGITRETHAGVECTSIRTGDNMATLPHQYSCSKQLRLLRNMLLREQGDELILGQAIPRHWLAPGLAVEVKQAPTTFGPVSFRVAASEDGKKLIVRFDPPARTLPRSIRLSLRHPELEPPTTVRTEPAVELTRDGESLRFAPPKSTITIEAVYE